MALVDNTTGGRVIKQMANPVKITLTDTCNVGDPIGFDAVTANVWKRADANAKIFADLIAGERCKTSGDEITCYRMAVVSGILTGIPGKPVYLSDTPGQYADNPVSTWSQAIGMCISATEMFLVPNTIPPAAYAAHAVQGVYFRTEIEALAVAESPLYGFRVDLKTLATSVIGDAYVLYLMGQMQVVPTGGSAFIRMEDNSDAGSPFEDFIMCLGALQSFVLDLGPTNEPSGGAWSRDGTSKTVNAGFIKVRIGTTTKYINLYTS